MAPYMCHNQEESISFGRDEGIVGKVGSPVARCCLDGSDQSCPGCERTETALALLFLHSDLQGS